MKKTREILKSIGRGIITISSMVAVNEVIGYHANPYKSATTTRLGCNIAGYSIGFFVGQAAGDAVIEAIEDTAIRCFPELFLEDE